MDYVVEKLEGFKLVGFTREFAFDHAYEEIPKFWAEFGTKYMMPLMQKDHPEDNLEEAIWNCRIGEFGVCLDTMAKEDKFKYMIGGIYTEGDIPEGMEVCEIPAFEWVKFTCKGPAPAALQSLNTKVFKEWLPGNHEFEIADGLNIEWYGMGDPSSVDYESGIWVPVRRKA